MRIQWVIFGPKVSVWHHWRQNVFYAKKRLLGQGISRLMTTNMCKHVHFLSVATFSTPEKVKEPLSRSFLFIYYISNPFYQWLLERGYKHLSFCPSFRPVCHRAVVSSWTNLLENIYTVVCSIISSTNRYFILFRPVGF